MHFEFLSFAHFLSNDTQRFFYATPAAKFMKVLTLAVLYRTSEDMRLFALLIETQLEGLVFFRAENC